MSIYCRNDRGQTLTEYILVVVLLVVGFLIVVAITGYQDILSDAVAFIHSKVPVSD